MVTYAFEKLYADLVTDDGTVCIAYLTWLEILGLRRGSGALEIYSPDGRREVVHALAAPSLPDLAASSWEVRLDAPKGPVVLRYHAQCGAWTPEGAPPGVEWSVKVANANVEVEWLNDPVRPVLRGRGYADWVALRRMTRGLGLVRVEWGRAHVGDVTWVFNRTQMSTGEVWARALTANASQRQEWQAVCLQQKEEATAVTAPDGSQVHLVGGRIIHEGPALDRERIPSRIERTVAKLVSPAIHETRWVRRALVSSVPRVGWALQECVRFQ